MKLTAFTKAQGEIVESSRATTQATSEFSKLATAILHWNGQLQKPPMTVTQPKIAVQHHKNVTKVQLRNVSGGQYLLDAGTHNIEPGSYVLSLHGNTYPEAFIWASVYYD